MLALAVVTALALLRYWDGFYRTQAAELEEVAASSSRHAESVASAVSEALNLDFQALGDALRRLAALSTRNGRLTAADLQVARGAMPPGWVVDLVRVKASGYVAAAANRLDNSLYLGDQPFFQHHAASSGDQLRVDPPVVTRWEDRWLLPVSRVLRDRSGRFDGVVVAALSPEQIAAGLRNLRLGSSDVVGVVHDDGSFVARSYRSSEALGQKVRTDRAFLQPGAAEAGSFRGRGSFDGVDRAWAYRRLTQFNLTVAVGLDLAEQLKPVNERHTAEFENAVLASAMAIALLGALLALLWRLDGVIRNLSASEERLKMALEGASELAWDWRAKTNTVTLLGNCRLFLGIALPSVEMPLAEWRDRVHPDDHESVRAAWAGYLDGTSRDFEVEYRVLAPEDKYRWVLVRGSAEQRDESGRALRVTGVLIDIDPIKKAQLTITRLSARYQQLFASASEGIYVVDAAGAIEMMNTAAQRLTGWTEDEVRGKNAHGLFHEALAGHPEHSWATCPINRAMLTGEVRSHERLVYWRKDGSAMPVELSIGPLRQGVQSDGAIVVFTDITERLATERQLEMLATTDELTGLANRRRFVEIAERDLARSAREATPATLIMMDLDHFKSVNDRFGHASGDLVLRAVTAACSSQLRAVDVFGRLGGEEFAVFLANIEPERALEVAERMRVAAGRRRVSIHGRDVGVTVSLGLAHAQPGESLDSLLARADAALYRAKEGGRDRVMVAPAPSHPAEAF